MLHDPRLGAAPEAVGGPSIRVGQPPQPVVDQAWRTSWAAGEPHGVDTVKGARLQSERIGMRHRRGLDAEIPAETTDAMSPKSIARIRRWTGDSVAVDTPADTPPTGTGRIKKRRR
jgi:hypothetical protein